MSQELPKEIFDALKENNEVLLANTDVLREVQEENKESLSEQNIVNKKEPVRTVLTPDERKRYSLIGEEFFKSFFKKLQKIKNDENMLIKDDVESINKNLKEQYKEKEKPEKSEVSFLDIIVLATITFALLKNTIISFFEAAKSKFDDFIKFISEPFNNLSFDGILESLRKLIPDFSPVTKVLEDLKNKIIEEAKKGWKLVSDAWRNIWKGFSLDSVLTAVKNAFAKVPEAIIAALEGIISMIKNLFNLEDDDADDTPQPDGPNPEDEQKRMQELQMALGAFFASAQGQVKTTEQIVKEVDGMIETWKKKASEFGVGDDAINGDKLSEEKVKQAYREFVTKKLTDLHGYNKFQEGSKFEEEIKKLIDEKDKLIKENNFSGFNEEQVEELINKAISAHGLESESHDEVREALTKQIEEANGVLFQQANAVNSLLKIRDDVNDGNSKTVAAALAAARAQGLQDDFMFLEARDIILKSVESLKTYFTNFESTLNGNIAKEIKEGFKNLKLPVNVDVEPIVNEDNSSHTFIINAIDETKIKILNDKITELSQEMVNEIKNQNTTLEKIKKLLEEKRPSPVPNDKPVSINIPNQPNDGGNTNVSNTGLALEKKLREASKLV